MTPGRAKTSTLHELILSLFPENLALSSPEFSRILEHTGLTGLTTTSTAVTLGIKPVAKSRATLLGLSSTLWCMADD